MVSNGDEWRKHRKVISPSFQIQAPVKMFETYANMLFGIWDAIPRDKRGEFVVDSIHPRVQALAIDVLRVALLGYDFQVMFGCSFVLPSVSSRLYRIQCRRRCSRITA